VPKRLIICSQRTISWSLPGVSPSAISIAPLSFLI
jgi:hypothetical protein